LSTSATATPADIEWLTGPAAAPWLDMAAQWTGEPLALLTALRMDLTADRAGLVVEQATLRRRGAAKFTDAQRMFFTARGLEQATDEAVARYKAWKLPLNQQLADLCCGIGGDLLAMAERGPVIGVDIDPITAALASANLRLPLPQREGWGEGLPEGARIVVADVGNFRVADLAAWHLDPDRRPAGRRTTRIELHEPGPEIIARRLGECPNAAIKLAPGADFGTKADAKSVGSDVIAWREAELEWISRKGQCRQLVAWFGSLARAPGMRRATRLASSLSVRGAELVVASFVGSPGVQPPLAGAIGRFVFEPDAAVLAADLTGALAADLELQPVASGTAYLTADEPRHSALLDSFEVLAVMPYQVKSLKAWLRARGVGQLEVKKRGVDLDPLRVKRELGVPGDETATLLVCRIGRKMTAILARRVVEATMSKLR
jgi:hypothetical protein